MIGATEGQQANHQWSAHFIYYIKVPVPGVETSKQSVNIVVCKSDPLAVDDLF